MAKVPLTKKFNGLLYRRKRFLISPGLTEDYVKIWRERGFNVRVVKGDYAGFAVYIRKKNQSK